MNGIFRASVSGIAVIMTVLSSGTAFAQSAVSQDTADSAYQSQDIIVQARRRDERLQDVPLSVAAVTTETLQRNNITSVADAASSTSKQAQEASLDTESLRELSVRLEELVRGFQT